MGKFPALSGSAIIDVLKKSRLVVKRQKGSHVFLSHLDGRATVVPIHSGETIRPGLFAKILRDTDLTESRFCQTYQKIAENRAGLMKPSTFQPHSNFITPIHSALNISKYRPGPGRNEEVGRYAAEAGLLCKSGKVALRRWQEWQEGYGKVLDITQITCYTYFT